MAAAIPHLRSAHSQDKDDKMSQVVSHDGVPSGSRQPKTDWRRMWGLREMGVYYALIFLVLVLSVATAYTDRPSYLSFQNVANVLQQASLTAIIAVAMTVI